MTDYKIVTTYEVSYQYHNLNVIKLPNKSDLLNAAHRQRAIWKCGCFENKLLCTPDFND